MKKIELHMATWILRDLFSVILQKWWSRRIRIVINIDNFEHIQKQVEALIENIILDEDNEKNDTCYEKYEESRPYLYVISVQFVIIIA